MCDPVRIQMKNTKGWKMPPNTIYVGRGTFWGNPFIVGKDGTAQECLEKYVKLRFPYTHRHGNMHEFLISELHVSEAREELEGKNLACWCPIGQPCHVDVLIKIANCFDYNNDGV